jgi:hypothetical protein
LREEERGEGDADDDPHPVRPLHTDWVLEAREVEEVDRPQLHAPMTRPRLWKRHRLSREVGERVGRDKDDDPDDQIQNDADEQNKTVELEFVHGGASLIKACGEGLGARIVLSSPQPVNDDRA